jgi:hypothetical protein
LLNTLKERLNKECFEQCKECTEPTHSEVLEEVEDQETELLNTCARNAQGQHLVEVLVEALEEKSAECARRAPSKLKKSFEGSRRAETLRRLSKFKSSEEIVQVCTETLQGAQRPRTLTGSSLCRQHKECV